MLEPPFGEVPAPHLAAARHAHEALSGLGHRVTHLPRIPATLDEFVPVYQFMFAQLPVPFKDALHPTTRWFIEEGEKQSAEAMRRRADDLSARVDDAWADADFLLTPTVATKTPRIGAFEGLPPAAHFDAVSPLGVFTAPFNLGGQPAVHLPLGHDDEGMPVGVQLVGRRGDDAAVLALAQQLAEAAGAKAEVPPIAERATRRPPR